LLTAEEIETMRFPDLRLTVLSACDTGLGEIDSEGVWGLQRAFRIAGTKNLICTLSKVDDYWTAQFMDAFYEQAAKGKSIYDSFHIAQQWLYRELPDNPEIWSSFILIE
ncbi:MAG: CHAT domain-containing protein, partial [Muribaculaceae bacterium]|nr:CHAT domain-containing protein [Muribaculaceae bacterium]